MHIPHLACSDGEIPAGATPPPQTERAPAAATPPVQQERQVTDGL